MAHLPSLVNRHPLKSHRGIARSPLTLSRRIQHFFRSDLGNLRLAGGGALCWAAGFGWRVTTMLPNTPVIESLPPPAVVRNRLGDALREVELLRGLLRLAE